MAVICFMDTASCYLDESLVFLGHLSVVALLPFREILLNMRRIACGVITSLYVVGVTNRVGD